MTPLLEIGQAFRVIVYFSFAQSQSKKFILSSK